MSQIFVPDHHGNSCSGDTRFDQLLDVYQIVTAGLQHSKYGRITLKRASIHIIRTKRACRGISIEIPVESLNGLVATLKLKRFAITFLKLKKPIHDYCNPLPPFTCLVHWVLLDVSELLSVLWLTWQNWFSLWNRTGISSLIFYFSIITLLHILRSLDTDYGGYVSSGV